jgi:hypothetical protein
LVELITRLLEQAQAPNANASAKEKMVVFSKPMNSSFTVSRRTTGHCDGVGVGVGDMKARQPRAVTIHGGIAMPLIELDSLEHAQMMIASASAIQMTAMFEMNSRLVDEIP